MEVYETAIKKWGEDSQIDMIVEECAELIKAIQKMRRNKSPEAHQAVLEELADVRIMVEQAYYIFGREVCEYQYKQKIKRLIERLMQQ